MILELSFGEWLNIFFKSIVRLGDRGWQEMVGDMVRNTSTEYHL